MVFTINLGQNQTGQSADVSTTPAITFPPTSKVENSACFCWALAPPSFIDTQESSTQDTTTMMQVAADCSTLITETVQHSTLGLT